MSKLSIPHLDQKPARLYYLDWLRVLAILGVFLFHAVHPFDVTDWHIKNAEQSIVITFFIAFLFPWGMPFFFLLAGAGSWFALRRRTAGQYAPERYHRLLLPYIGGAIVLMPLMLYFEWLHKSQRGLLTGPFMDYLLDRNAGFSPVWFGALGYHLWFLGFLFSFSILCLPIFLWLKGETGHRFVLQLAVICERRGFLLLFFIPLAILRLALHPFFPQEHNWADFVVQLSFFLIGFILFSQDRFLHIIRRDWRIHLGIGITAAAFALAIAASTNTLNLEDPPRTLLDILFWILISIDSWGWVLFFLFLGMRYLDFTNSYLEYGQEAIVPFFVFHQPVIIILAFFAVQWDASLGVKLLFVVLGSFCVTLGIYEVLIRRIAPLSRIFGVKMTPSAKRARSRSVGEGVFE